MIVRLDLGPHKSPDRGVCAAEATAFLAREPHSNHPECLCPILGETIFWLHDRMADDDRCLLVPLLSQLDGTRCSGAERMRAQMIASAVCRTVRHESSGYGHLEAALDWIGGQGDMDDALAILEAEDQRLAWLCAEILFGGPGEIVSTALAWLDQVIADGERKRLWQPMVLGLESAIRLGPHSGVSQRLLWARQRRLEAIQRGRVGGYE